jgi:hypothetical protein
VRFVRAVCAAWIRPYTTGTRPHHRDRPRFSSDTSWKRCSGASTRIRRIRKTQNPFALQVSCSRIRLDSLTFCRGYGIGFVCWGSSRRSPMSRCVGTRALGMGSARASSCGGLRPLRALWRRVRFSATTRANPATDGMIARERTTRKSRLGALVSVLCVSLYAGTIERAGFVPYQ